MSEFAANNPWILALIGLLLGALIGMLLTLLFERRKSGGRTVEEMQREMDDYKEEVGNHFATTSELFQDMTEKYRDVYNHLASGSQNLCEDSMGHARLEFAEAKPVTADDSDKNPADSAETVNTDDQMAAEGAGESAARGVDKVENKPSDPPLGV